MFTALLKHQNQLEPRNKKVCISKLNDKRMVTSMLAPLSYHFMSKHAFKATFYE